MSVGIITFHFVNNFGGALQAYALWKTVHDKVDENCALIDYRNPFICLTDSLRMFPITRNPKAMVKGIKTFGKRFVRLKLFRLFLKSNCRISGRYRSYSALKRNPPVHDKYLCGSDQIWNPIITGGVDPAYYLGFVDDPSQKIAYAPSMGGGSIKKIFRKKMAGYLKGISHLSVREGDCIDFIKSIAGGDVVQLIDPTFLLTAPEWERVISPPKREEKYILLYIMQKDDAIYELAREIKEKLGIKLIEISRYGYKRDFVDETVVDVGPSEFLGYILGAECVCTNSYHGFVFSVIFGKQLYLVPSKRFSARIKSLARLLGIALKDKPREAKDRLVAYDKKDVAARIEAERAKSIAYLRNSIRNEK